MVNNMQAMESFYKTVDLAIETNRLNRELYQREMYLVSPAKYAIDFCTVHVNCGRRVGKSEYIKDHLNYGDVIIAPNLDMREYLKWKLHYQHVYSVSEFSYGLPDSFSNRTLPRTTIWMDEVGFCSDSEIGKVYSALACRNVPNQTFIRLGR